MKVLSFTGKVEVTLLAARRIERIEAAHIFLSVSHYVSYVVRTIGYVMSRVCFASPFFSGKSMRERGKLPLKIKFRSTKTSETAKSV